MKVKYAEKSVLKGTTGIDTSNFSKKKTDLANLTLDVDSLYIAKLETTLTDLSKLSNVVKDKFIKKFVNDDLVNMLVLMIQTNKILEKRLKMLIERYLIPVNLL